MSRLAPEWEPSATQDPVALLDSWVGDAVDAGCLEPTAMCVATVSPAGEPSSRLVLMRQLDPSGPVFYTNYLSRKGRELDANPAIAATFWWAQLDRQVRIEGNAERLSADRSDAYFASRPYLSRLSAAASPQSAPIPSRRFLDEQVAELQRLHPHDIPRPAHWGGVLIVARSFEFWVGRPGRLHDRFRCTRLEDRWEWARLAP